MAGPRNAEDRLARLLVMLPWLMEVGEVPLAEVAARYDLTEAQVQKDLELVAMCGLPPFVDEMVDVFVDDGLVFVGVPRLFTRPLRLTAPEGFSLLTSARAAMELPGADADGSLGRGLAKLAAALSAVGLDGVEPADGDDGAAGADDTAGVAIDLARPPLADDLAEAVASNAEAEIVYYSPARDEVTTRIIVPRHVFVDAGHWYTVADDERSGERRTFRIDRIERVTPTGRTVPTDDVVHAPEGFFVDVEVPRVTLRIGPTARWIVERYPVDEVRTIEGRDGWLDVDLPAASDRWLARLLIRLGPDVEVADEVGALATELAERILANY